MKQKQQQQHKEKTNKKKQQQQQQQINVSSPSRAFVEEKNAPKIQEKVF